MPALSTALCGLDPITVSRFENHPLSIPAIRNACPDLVREIETLSAWPAIACRPSPIPMPKRIPLKKWRQVAYLVGVLQKRAPTKVTRYVDWCAGKGHLGGAINNALAQPVVGIEKEPILCAKGEAEADIRGSAVTFACADVLTPAAAVHLDDTCGVVALHACGRLNIALLRQGVAANVPFMAVVPCCYQRIDGMMYRPISDAARAETVPLTRHLLRLPSLDDNLTGTAGRRRRVVEHAYRLGLDLLIRKATGRDVYHPLGPVKPRYLKHGFECFARSVAAAKGMPLPPKVDWKSAEAAGWRRYHVASALGLARALFRRAIESYLLLDRICYLEENGYRVEAGTFCPFDITPRNLIILAYR